MDNSLLVIFGLPGAGKSYVARILEEKFGYFIHDGDDDIPKHMRNTLFRKQEITDDMRKEFISNLISSIKKLSSKHNKLAMHQTLLKEFMRNQLLEAFPDAQFILVESPDALREKRYMRREYFNLGLSYLRHMSDLFEPVGIPHTKINNSAEGEQNLLQQLQNIQQLDH